MSDLIEYLRARLDEDEAAVNRWWSKFQIRDADEPIRFGPDGTGLNLIFETVPATGPRMLADIAAKRAALDLVSERLAIADRTQHLNDHLHAGAGLEVLELLAQSYADRDDFDPEWRLA